jgi:hypothetical protein
MAELSLGPCRLASSSTRRSTESILRPSDASSSRRATSPGRTALQVRSPSPRRIADPPSTQRRAPSKARAGARQRPSPRYHRTAWERSPLSSGVEFAVASDPGREVQAPSRVPDRASRAIHRRRPIVLSVRSCRLDAAPSPNRTPRLIAPNTESPPRRGTSTAVGPPRREIGAIVDAYADAESRTSPPGERFYWSSAVGSLSCTARAWNPS